MGYETINVMPVTPRTPGQAVFASPLSPSRAYRWHSGAVG
jgi:hypothetical protein